VKLSLRQIRLLPVVIAATVALLLLKSLGIVTGGGYVLTGTTEVQAAGGGGHGESSGDAGGETTMTMPTEPTMSDSSPVLDDAAPTLPLRADTPAAGEHGTEVASTEEHAGEPAAGGYDEPATETAGQPVEEGHGDAGHEDDSAAVGDPSAACPPVEVEQPEPAHGEEGAGHDEVEGFDFIKEREKCVVDPGVNEQGDALPLIKDGAGNLVPLAQKDGAQPSEDAINERLSARRAELDQREDELDMRMALVEAAEKRIDERTAVLQQLEARINAMVDEKRTLEESQFTAVVAMYETMKPKDAAAIFDKLDMNVLLRVARAINPRKMAPIMAKMDATKAMELTAGLAVDQVEPTIEMSSEDLTALPQIVGQ
jgi:flagellar motility protein MotE (MotC chaperone)